MKQFWFSCVLLFVLASAALAQTTSVPPLMNFQGRLAKPDGTPVANGTYTLRFSLWTGDPEGIEKWSQTFSRVEVRNGTFAVLFSGFAANTFNGNLWLEIKIGSAHPLTPRQQLVSVAYAMKANSVPDNSIGTTQLANNAVTNAKVSDVDWSKVTNRPASLLTLPYSGSGSSAGAASLFSVTNTGTGRAIAGISTGGGYGGYFSSTGGLATLYAIGNTSNGIYSQSQAANGNGILGIANNGTSAYGVYGRSNNGIGVYTSSDTGYGLVGTSNSGYGGYFASTSGTASLSGQGGAALGVYGESTSPFGTGVKGVGNNGTSSYGVYGESNQGVAVYGAGGIFGVIGTSTDGTGVSGSSSTNIGTVGASGSGPGVLAQSNSSYGISARSFSNYAGRFISDTASGLSAAGGGAYGVYGESTNSTGLGVYGVALNGASAVGVFGQSNGDGVSGQSLGGGNGVRGKSGSGSGGYFTSGHIGVYAAIDVAGSSGTGVYAIAGSGSGSLAGAFFGNVLITGTILGQSDQRFKTNVKPLDNALATILNLRGTTFDWEHQKWPERRFPAGRQIGFIAQEVEQVLPELVSTDKDGYKSVAYINVVPVLVEAVKTLHAKHERAWNALKHETDAVRKENAELKARLAAIEQALTELKSSRR